MMTKEHPRVLSAGTMMDTPVVDTTGEKIGRITEFMIDLERGTIAYAVLSFGGFLGFADKLFAVPFGALEIDTENTRFVLDADKERLEEADGFDKSDWPEFTLDFHTRTYEFWNVRPYWTV